MNPGIRRRVGSIRIKIDGELIVPINNFEVGDMAVYIRDLGRNFRPFRVFLGQIKTGNTICCRWFVSTSFNLFIVYDFTPSQHEDLLNVYSNQTAWKIIRGTL